MGPTDKELHHHWVKRYLFEFHAWADLYVCGRQGLCHKGWLILTQVDSSLTAVIYFTTHVRGIGGHLNWSPFPCEIILLAW